MVLMDRASNTGVTGAWLDSQDKRDADGFRSHLVLAMPKTRLNLGGSNRGSDMEMRPYMLQAGGGVVPMVEDPSAVIYAQARSVG